VKKRSKQIIQIAVVFAFGIFLAVSFGTDYGTGEQVGRTFTTTLLQMLKLLPCAFILVALFDVWIKRETVERHFGESSGIRGYLWAILLGGMTIGGMYLGFPVAYSLFKKGARLPVVFAYVGFAGACRIPMTMFEISFMGPLFTAVRLGVSIPLIILTSMALGRFLERRGYEITE